MNLVIFSTVAENLFLQIWVKLSQIHLLEFKTKLAFHQWVLRFHDDFLKNIQILLRNIILFCSINHDNSLLLEF